MNLDKILEKIYTFYPPDPRLYQDNGFYHSAAGEKVYTEWESRDEEKIWLPFIDKLKEQTGLDLLSLTRSTEFCYKACGNFTDFSAENVDSTIVISLSTMVPFHSVYVSQRNLDHEPLRTFFDSNGNSVQFIEPCFSEECRKIGEGMDQMKERHGTDTLLTCSLKPGAVEVIINISDMMAQTFGTTILPLEFVNSPVDHIAIEDSFVGDVNIYTATFTPHIL